VKHKIFEIHTNEKKEKNAIKINFKNMKKQYESLYLFNFTHIDGVLITMLFAFGQHFWLNLQQMV